MMFNKLKILIGVQSFNKRELERYIKNHDKKNRLVVKAIKRPKKCQRTCLFM